MKRIRIIRRLSALLSFAVTAAAQTITADFAPINLGNFVMTSTPSNATGNGGISTIFTSSGTELTFGTGGALVNPLDFSYTVTGPNTATISRAATDSSPASTTKLVFDSAKSGTYTTVAGTETTTGSFNLADIPGAAPIANVSTRTTVSPGAPTIVGFVVAGTMPRRVLVRAVGPGLSKFGVTTPLSNPSLSLYRGTQPIATNDDWGILAAVSAGTGAGPSSGATGSGLLTGLGATTSGTLMGPGVTAGTGVTTATGSTTSTGSTSTITGNITIDTSSTGMGNAGTSTIGNATIGTTGTSVTSGTSSTSGAGAMSDDAFTGTLANGATFSTELATDATFTQVGAFGLQAGSHDAAFVATLPPGAYSVIVNYSATMAAETASGTNSGGSTAVTGGTGISSTGSTGGGAAGGNTGTSTGSTSGGASGGNATTGTGSTTITSTNNSTTGATTGEVLVEVYFME